MFKPVTKFLVPPPPPPFQNFWDPPLRECWWYSKNVKWLSKVQNVFVISKFSCEGELGESVYLIMTKTNISDLALWAFSGINTYTGRNIGSDRNW